MNGVKDMKSLYEIDKDNIMQGVRRFNSDYMSLKRLAVHQGIEKVKHPHFKGKIMLNLSKNLKPRNNE